MKPLNYLSIDYGEKYIGLATFQEDRDPFPLKYGRLRNSKGEKIFKDLMEIIEENQVDTVVVGLSKYPDGKDSKMTKMIQEFVEKFKNYLK